MIKSNFVWMVMICICWTANAQEDFIVTAKSDTMRGRVTFQQIGNVEQVLVKGEKRVNLSSLDVRMAIQKGKTFKPVQYAGKVQMMEVLTDGYLSLLAFQPDGVMNYDGRLLMLRDGKKLEVPTIGFKKHLSNFLSANEELAEEIKSGDLDRKDLDQIIKRYNETIENRSANDKQQAVIEVAQKSKIELVDEILEVVKKSELASKEETIEMLNELKDKVENQRSIPQYLGNALRENLKSDADLIAKLDSLLKE